MGVEKGHLVGAVDVKRLAVIHAVAGNNGRARPAFAVKKNVRVPGQLKIRGKKEIGRASCRERV